MTSSQLRCLSRTQPMEKPWTMMTKVSTSWKMGSMWKWNWMYRDVMGTDPLDRHRNGILHSLSNRRCRSTRPAVGAPAPVQMRSSGRLASTSGTSHVRRYCWNTSSGSSTSRMSRVKHVREDSKASPTKMSVSSTSPVMRPAVLKSSCVYASSSSTQIQYASAARHTATSHAARQGLSGTKHLVSSASSTCCCARDLNPFPSKSLYCEASFHRVIKLTNSSKPSSCSPLDVTCSTSSRRWWSSISTPRLVITSLSSSTSIVPEPSASKRLKMRRMLWISISETTALPFVSSAMAGKGAED
mmetsp:Transcript_36769/g.113414  ORF Transcript_36769/g.113414 Transcript_36769/m.113414 type:complete len:300 (-) Transcript_36769:231-1130(-)